MRGRNQHKGNVRVRGVNGDEGSGEGRGWWENGRGRGEEGGWGGSPSPVGGE